MMTLTTTTMALQIGNRKIVRAVASVAEAKQLVSRLRDQMELAGRGGASRFPTIRLIDATGHTIGHASYNGRMWEGEARAWTPTTRELL
jgi:hypothetical protein